MADEDALLSEGGSPFGVLTLLVSFERGEGRGIADPGVGGVLNGIPTFPGSNGCEVLGVEGGIGVELPLLSEVPLGVRLAEFGVKCPFEELKTFLPI